MKITFLGTSHGVPSAERYCSCTMIEVGGATYFIDCGAPLIDLLIRRGTDLNSIRAIFTTHMHGDHVNGLTAFADLCNWYYKTTSFDVYLTDERGIRTFETSYRNTLDISAIPMLKKKTHLPVIVDPSHAAGIRFMVEPLAMAAIAAGADGLMIEVHNNPEKALCDGAQSLTPEMFDHLMKKVDKAADFFHSLG